MQWLLDNWILVLFGGGMIAMHLFGHGHGGHKSKQKDAAPGDVDAGGGSVKTTDTESDTDGLLVKAERNRDM